MEGVPIAFHLKSQLKKHVCARCGANFKWPNQLRTHMLKHEGKTPSKPHQCQHCDMRFDKLDNMMRHISRQHKLKYKDVEIFLHCAVCNNKYRRRLDLHKHMEQDHNIKISPQKDHKKKKKHKKKSPVKNNAEFVTSHLANDLDEFEKHQREVETAASDLAASLLMANDFNDPSLFNVQNPLHISPSKSINQYSTEINNVTESVEIGHNKNIVYNPIVDDHSRSPIKDSDCFLPSNFAQGNVLVKAVQIANNGPLLGKKIQSPQSKLQLGNFVTDVTKTTCTPDFTMEANVITSDRIQSTSELNLKQSTVNKGVTVVPYHINRTSPSLVTNSMSLEQVLSISDSKKFSLNFGLNPDPQLPENFMAESPENSLEGPISPMKSMNIRSLSRNLDERLSPLKNNGTIHHSVSLFHERTSPLKILCTRNGVHINRISPVEIIQAGKKTTPEKYVNKDNSAEAQLNTLCSSSYSEKSNECKTFENEAAGGNDVEVISVDSDSNTSLISLTSQQEDVTFPEKNSRGSPDTEILTPVNEVEITNEILKSIEKRSKSEDAIKCKSRLNREKSCTSETVAEDNAGLVFINKLKRRLDVNYSIDLNPTEQIDSEVPLKKKQTKFISESCEFQNDHEGSIQNKCTTNQAKLVDNDIQVIGVSHNSAKKSTSKNVGKKKARKKKSPTNTSKVSEKCSKKSLEQEKVNSSLRQPPKITLFPTSGNINEAKDDTFSAIGRVSEAQDSVFQTTGGVCETQNGLFPATGGVQDTQGNLFSVTNTESDSQLFSSSAETQNNICSSISEMNGVEKPAEVFNPDPLFSTKDDSLSSTEMLIETLNSSVIHNITGDIDSGKQPAELRLNTNKVFDTRTTFQSSEPMLHTNHVTLQDNNGSIALNTNHTQNCSASNSIFVKEVTLANLGPRLFGKISEMKSNSSPILANKQTTLNFQISQPSINLGVTSPQMLIFTSTPSQMQTSESHLKNTSSKSFITSLNTADVLHMNQNSSLLTSGSYGRDSHNNINIAPKFTTEDIVKFGDINTNLSVHQNSDTSASVPLIEPTIQEIIQRQPKIAPKVANTYVNILPILVQSSNGITNISQPLQNLNNPIIAKSSDKKLPRNRRVTTNKAKTPKKNASNIDQNVSVMNDDRKLDKQTSNEENISKAVEQDDESKKKDSCEKLVEEMESSMKKYGVQPLLARELLRAKRQNISMDELCEAKVAKLLEDQKSTDPNTFQGIPISQYFQGAKCLPYRSTVRDKMMSPTYKSTQEEEQANTLQRVKNQEQLRARVAAYVAMLEKNARKKKSAIAALASIGLDSSAQDAVTTAQSNISRSNASSRKTAQVSSVLPGVSQPIITAAGGDNSCNVVKANLLNSSIDVTSALHNSADNNIKINCSNSSTFDGVFKVPTKCAPSVYGTRPLKVVIKNANTGHTSQQYTNVINANGTLIVGPPNFGLNPTSSKKTVSKPPGKLPTTSASQVIDLKNVLDLKTFVMKSTLTSLPEGNKPTLNVANTKTNIVSTLQHVASSENSKNLSNFLSDKNTSCEPSNFITMEPASTESQTLKVLSPEVESSENTYEDTSNALKNITGAKNENISLSLTDSLQLSPSKSIPFMSYNQKDRSATPSPNSSCSLSPCSREASSYFCGDNSSQSLSDIDFLASVASAAQPLKTDGMIISPTKLINGNSNCSFDFHDANSISPIKDISPSKDGSILNIQDIAPAELQALMASPIKSFDMDNSNLSTASQNELLETLQNFLRDIPKLNSPSPGKKDELGSQSDSLTTKEQMQSVYSPSKVKRSLSDFYANDTSPPKIIDMNNGAMFLSASTPVFELSNSNNNVESGLDGISMTTTAITPVTSISYFTSPSLSSFCRYVNTSVENCHMNNLRFSPVNTQEHFTEADEKLDDDKSSCCDENEVYVPKPFVVNAPELHDENTMDRIVSDIEDLKNISSNA